MPDRMANSGFYKEVVDLRAELAILKIELKNICVELKEVEMTNKILMEFMYKMQGGKAWLFSLLTVAASVGSILGISGSFLWHR